MQPTFRRRLLASTLFASAAFAAAPAWAQAEPGQAVNVEVDILARYVARLREFSPT